MKIKAISMSVILIMMSLLTACLGPKVIKIGMIGDFSGRGAELCVPIRETVDLLVEGFNDSQNDYEIQLVAKDHQGSADKTGEILSEFIDEGIEVVIGPILSSIAYENYDYMTNGDLLFISPTVSTVSLEDIDDYLVRVIPTNETQGKNLGEKAIASTSNHKAAVLIESTNREFTYYVAEGFVEMYEAGGGTIVYNSEFETGSSQILESLAVELLESGAEDFLVVSSSLDVAQLCQYLVTMDGDFNLYTSVWANQDALIEMGGSAVDDVYLLGAFHETSVTEEFNAFRDQYKEKYSVSLTITGGYAYDAMAVLTGILEKGIYKDIESMKTAILETGTFGGFSEPFSINEYGDADRGFVLYQVDERDIVKVD